MQLLLSGLKDLEKLVNEEEVIPVQIKGNIKDYSYVKDEYIKFLKPYAKNLENLNLSIDCSSGMANLIIKDIIGSNHNYLNDTFDGTFPSHEPNPLDEENCKELENAVIKNQSDAGIIYDGDADRVIFVDDKGRWIQPDYITSILGYYYSQNGRTGNALVDIRTSKSTTDYLSTLGWKVTIWKVGHAFAKLKIREIDGVFGGELAGHYYFRDFFNCDSGVLASLLVLSVIKELKSKGQKLSEFIDSIISYSNSSEINFKLDNKDAAILELYKTFAPNAKTVYDFDGYRLEYDDWWFNVRKSNTEPYLRIVCEAKNNKLLKEKIDEISSIIKKYN